ncbi:TPA: hypothetical protein RTG63_001663 [Campylobacter jejuni]|nr:hypothetical protein [Campylobacter jejuni]
MERNSDNLNNFTDLEIALASGQIRTKEHLYNIKDEKKYSKEYMESVVYRMSEYQYKNDDEKVLVNHIKNCKDWIKVD